MTRNVLLVIAMLAAMGARAETNCKDESRYPIITKKELKEVVAKKAATIFDVNSEETFKEGHVPGAIHFGTHSKDFAKLLPKDKSALIVAYCGGPMCTAWEKAAEEACKLGYTNIKHFKEGIKGWKS